MKGLIERDHKLYIRKVYRDSTGKKKQIWRKVETRSEGKTLLREIENDLANGTESFENRDSLDSYLDKWLSMTKGTISDRTHADYESLLRLYFRPVLGKKRLTSVKPMDIQNVITDMAARGLSSRTIQYAHAVLQKALKEAVNVKTSFEDESARELEELCRKFSTVAFLRCGRFEPYDGNWFPAAYAIGLQALADTFGLSQP